MTVIHHGNVALSPPNNLHQLQHKVVGVFVIINNFFTYFLVILQYVRQRYGLSAPSTHICAQCPFSLPLGEVYGNGAFQRIFDGLEDLTGKVHVIDRLRKAFAK